MGATNQSFTMTAGDTIRLNVTITTPAGVPIDLTGAFVIWVLKREVAAPNNALKKTTDDDINITDVKNGKISIYLRAEDSEGFSGNYYHEAKLIDGLGEVSRPFKGNIYFEKSGV